MRAHRKHVDILFFHVDGQMSRRLHRVRVERYALFAAHRADFRNRQNRTDFVVRVHRRYKAGIFADGVFHLFRRNIPLRSHRQKFNLEALFFQLFQRMQHRVVFERRGNDMFLSLARPRRRSR